MTTNAKGMKPSATIELTQGKVAIVDKEDLYLLKAYSWHAVNTRGKFYAQTAVGRYLIPMHRLVIGLSFDDKRFSDHKNLNGLDNRKENLRVATPSQNMMNRPKTSRKTTSKFKGVQYRPIEKRWMANVYKEGKRVWHKYCLTELEAAKEYDKNAARFHGEFARVNFPEQHEAKVKA